MNRPLDYVALCTKDVNKILGVYKPDYFPITSCSMKTLETKVCFVASPQECVRVVPKQ